MLQKIDSPLDYCVSLHGFPFTMAEMHAQQDDLVAGIAGELPNETTITTWP